jgi:cell division protease FtsH
MKELEEARDKVRWGRERRSMAMSDEDKKFTAWHEAGHALVNVLLKHTHPLHKVTIIPRGRALGVTMSLPKEDILNAAAKELLDHHDDGRTHRRGNCCPEDISSGAAMDIQQATQAGPAMVMPMGHERKAGHGALRRRARNMFSWDAT